MFRLNGQDAYMLYQDTPTTPMHTLKILVGRHTGRVPGIREVKQAILANLDSVPGLRRRIVWVPFGLHHPVVIDDPEFDIDLHVHRLAAPAPGGAAELDEVIAQISSHPLDHSRPLWELWMVEGLCQGRVAYVVKLHHAIADGQAVVNQLERLFGAAVRPGQAIAGQPWRPEPVPSVHRLIVDALRDQVRDIERLPALIGRTLRSVRRILRRWQAGQLRFPLPKDVPSTPFNRSLCGQRDFVTVRFALADFKQIKSVLGGTVNDVVVSVVAGALRGYLLDRGCLPAQPLVASIPAAGIEEPDARRVFGNTASGMPVFLRTDLEDVGERFAATRQALAGGKEFLELLGRDAFHNWTAYVPPLLYLAWQRLRVHFRLAERRHGDINVIISNVPGPRVHGTVAGFELQELISGGPLMEGMALNITAWSFGDQLNFGLVACRRAVPDLEQLAWRLQRQHAELFVLAARRCEGATDPDRSHGAAIAGGNPRACMS
jgi:diacylglycerol O-acyltransferase / wax synthase